MPESKSYKKLSALAEEANLEKTEVTTKETEEPAPTKVEVNVASPKVQVLSDVNVEDVVFAQPAETDDKGIKS